MPLLVPILRLAMLFLNIYDSYKVLKPPPPSPRHANHPSLRAITQRKRNLKGTLAIWIVWCCFTLYERLFEVIVSLFIPFYDEMKSLVIIFLMLTRSRGAEPIYLHIIRPFLKPYTETLDSVLDLMFVIGDIALATIFAPMNAILGIWKRIFGRGDKPSDNIQMDHDPSLSTTGDQIHEHVPTEIASREPPIPRSQIPRPMEIHRTDSGSLSRFMPKENSRPYTPPSQDENSNTTRKHEIWYPPPSAYQEDDEDTDGIPIPQRTVTSSLMDSEVTLVTVEQVDEWRQYPRFPAAYPPTPVVTITRLAPKSTALGIDSSLPKIDEVSKQGFQQSLSPPPETTNPDSDGDLSDERLDPGVHEMMEDDDRTATPDNYDVSMTESSFLDEDEEDEFNITLQTPILTRAIIKPTFHGSKMTSRSTSLATTSVRSLSTGLSTVENGSSLRTRTSLDSLSSTAMSSGEDSQVIGKKRPLPRSKNAIGRNTDIVSSGLDSLIVNDASGDKRHGPRHAPIMRSSNQQRNQGGGRTTSEVKKRRVTSPNKIAVRTSKPVRHVRPRFARPASPPARSQRFQRKPVIGHGVPALQLHDGAAPSGKSAPSRDPALRAAEERKFDENS
ncbi:hypothetical protein APHAL10511_001574 [Amanita phalloides]|nr:hypothetical protein APHAL10511_001574 [Amanita phalloides]